MTSLPAEPADAGRIDGPGLRLGLGLILLLGTLALYWPATGFEFTNFDDPTYVTENPMVQGGLTRDGVRWAFTATSSSLWLPLTRLGHLTAWELFGPASGGHHLINLLIHAINALLAFLVFNRLTGATIRSAFVAALFAWHPLRVESVAWVAELKDVLAVMFWLLTMACYVRFVRSGRGRDRWLLIVVFTLGLMAKPMLVTLPFALLLIDIWPLQRLRLPFSSTARNESPSQPGNAPLPANEGNVISWRTAVLEKLPLFVLAIGLCVLTMLTSKGGTAMSQLPITYRIANAFVSYARYLGKTFYPVDLAALYPHPGRWPTAEVAAAITLILGLSAVAWAAARKKPWVFTGWFWFLGTLVPVIGLVQAGPQAMADRFTYAPSLGLTALLVWSLAGLAPHLPFGRWGMTALGLAAVVACLGLARNQLGYWQNSIVLFEHTLSLTTSNEVAQYNLGQALSAAGRVAEAIPHYEEAVRLDPTYEDAWNNLGVNRSILGARTEAIQHYREALRINPRHVGAHFNLGLAAYLDGEMNLALNQFSNTVRLDPRHFGAYYWAGRIAVQEGNASLAATNLAQALALNPRAPEAHYEMGVLRLNLGERDAAIAHLRTAIQIRSDYADAYAKLGLALAGNRQAADAVAQFRQALLITPDALEPLNNLAWLLATDASAAIRNGADAVRLAQRACDVSSNQIPALIGTLAAAYAEAARFEEAARTARQAAELADRLGQTNLAVRNRELEALYLQRQPYRSP